jgi:SAM-dependent methyltransferase
MSNTARVDKKLFEGDHYLGKPADADDLIIQRRLNILKRYPAFVGKDLQLLEIGCGNGNTLLKLAGEFSNTIGLEYAESHKSEFDMLKSEWNVTNAEFVVWDIMQAPYTPPADRLLSFEVIEHLPDESGVMNYAHSVKNGALCAFTVPNKWWIFETHGARLPLLPWNRVPFFSWLPRPIHERFANARIYTKSRIKKLLEKSGFAVEDMVYVTAPMDVVKWPPLKNFLRKHVFGNDTTKWPFKAVSIFVIAKKN